MSSHSKPIDIHTNGNGATHTNVDEVDDGGLSMKVRITSMTSMDNQVPPSPTKSSSLKRNTSYGNLMPAETKETRVKVIYTGGTIGMVRNERNGKCLDRLSKNYYYLQFKNVY